ncbi:MAG: hypothetical protein M1561_06645 [Gammaproteobacteria bacterium]|nr:hypothetical protein [Gammaproteobacteria bacterium]
MEKNIANEIEGEQKVAAKLSLKDKLIAFLKKLGIRTPVQIKVPTNPSQYGVSLTFQKSAEEIKAAEQATKEAKGGATDFTKGKDATTFIKGLEATEGWKQMSQQMLEEEQIEKIDEAPRLLKRAFAMDGKETMVAFISDDAEAKLNQILDKP